MNKYKLTGVDVDKWTTNLLLFLAPVAVIYLASTAANITASGLSFSVFVPDAVSAGSMVLYIINALMDITRKYVQPSVA